MGRTRSFDTDEVLDRAVEVFWRRGFAATSVADLVDELGINRGSMYATFSSKDELYRQALGRYAAGTAAWLDHHLGDETVGLRERLRRILADAARNDGYKGCLVVNTTMECNAEHPDLRSATSAVFAMVRDALRDGIARGVDEGERLADGVGIDDATALVATLMQGLRVLSALDGVADTAEAAIDTALGELFAP